MSSKYSNYYSILTAAFEANKRRITITTKRTVCISMQVNVI